MEDKFTAHQLHTRLLLGHEHAVGPTAYQVLLIALHSSRQTNSWNLRVRNAGFSIFRHGAQIHRWFENSCINELPDTLPTTATPSQHADTIVEDIVRSSGVLRSDGRPESRACAVSANLERRILRRFDRPEPRAPGFYV